MYFYIFYDEKNELRNQECVCMLKEHHFIQSTQLFLQTYFSTTYHLNSVQQKHDNVNMISITIIA